MSDVTVCLSLVADGQSNKAIARQLFVTERTVEAHGNPDSRRRVLAYLRT